MNEIWEDFKEIKELIRISFLFFFFLLLFNDIIIFLFKFHFDIPALKDFYLYSLPAKAILLSFLFFIAFFPLIVSIVIIGLHYVLYQIAIIINKTLFSGISLKEIWQDLNQFYLTYYSVYFTAGPLIFIILIYSFKLFCFGYYDVLFIVSYMFDIYLCYWITVLFLLNNVNKLLINMIDIVLFVLLIILIFYLYLSNTSTAQFFILFLMLSIVPYLTFLFLFLNKNVNIKNILIFLLFFYLIVSFLFIYLDHKQWNNVNISEKIFLNKISFNLLLNKIFLIEINNSKFINISNTNSIYLYHIDNKGIYKKCIDKLENKELFLDGHNPVFLSLNNNCKILFKSLENNITCVYALQVAGEKKNHYDLIDVGYIDP